MMGARTDNPRQLSSEVPNSGRTGVTTSWSAIAITIHIQDSFLQGCDSSSPQMLGRYGTDETVVLSFQIRLAPGKDTFHCLEMAG